MSKKLYGQDPSNVNFTGGSMAGVDLGTAIYNQLHNSTFERWTYSGLTQGSLSGRQTAFNISNVFIDEDGSTAASWAGTGCTITDGGTNLLITQSGANTEQFAKYTLSGLTPTKRYKFVFTVANGTGTLGYAFKSRVEQNGGTIIRSSRMRTAGTYSIIWEAVGATDKIGFVFALGTGSGQTISITNVYVDEVRHGCVDADTYAADDHSKTTTLDCFREWNVASPNTYGYGKWLLKLVKGADTAEYYNFDDINIDYRDAQGKTVAFGCYVYSVTAVDNIKLSIYDGQSEIAVSTTHCGADSITWMEVTGTVAANATKVQPRILCDGDTSDIAYISHPVLLLGSKIGAGNYRVGPSLELPVGQFSSTENQTIASTSISYPITFNTDDVKQAIRHSSTTDNSRIKVTSDGTYLMAFSALVDCTSGTNTYMEIWLEVDGEQVANSNTKVQIPTASIEMIIAVTFTYTFTENQYFELVMCASNTNDRLVTTAAASGPPPRPASPSIILTVNKIS